MKKSLLWKRWMYFTFTWRIVNQREWQSIVDFLVCSKSQSSNRDKESKLYQQVNCRSFCFSSQSINCWFSFSSFRHLDNSRFSFCSSTSIDLYNNHFLEALRHRLIKRRIEVTHTHIHTHLISHQINKSTFKTSNKKIWVSFRFVRFSESVRFNDTQWVRYND